MLKPDWAILSDTGQSRGVPQPPLFKQLTSKSVDLEKIVPLSLVARSIFDRRSIREYSSEQINLYNLSYLLYLTQGIKDKMKPQYRVSPSAGARHSIETYVHCTNVERIFPALYKYDPMTDKIYFINEKPVIELHDALFGQARTAAAIFIWATIPYRMQWRYGHCSDKLICLDAGHICQNLYTACENINLGCCAIGAYDQKKLDDFLEVDGEQEFSLYCASIGRKKNA